MGQASRFGLLRHAGVLHAVQVAVAQVWAQGRQHGLDAPAAPLAGVRPVVLARDGQQIHPRSFSASRCRARSAKRSASSRMRVVSNAALGTNTGLGFRRPQPDPGQTLGKGLWPDRSKTRLGGVPLGVQMVRRTGWKGFADRAACQPDGHSELDGFKSMKYRAAGRPDSACAAPAWSKKAWPDSVACLTRSCSGLSRSSDRSPKFRHAVRLHMVFTAKLAGRGPVDGVLGLRLQAGAVVVKAALKGWPEHRWPRSVHLRAAPRPGFVPPNLHLIGAGKGFFAQVAFTQQALVVALARVSPATVDVRHPQSR